MCATPGGRKWKQNKTNINTSLYLSAEAGEPGDNSHVGGPRDRERQEEVGRAPDDGVDVEPLQANLVVQGAHLHPASHVLVAWPEQVRQSEADAVEPDHGQHCACAERRHHHLRAPHTEEPGVKGEMI